MHALHVVAQPYSEAQLLAAQQRVIALIAGMGLQSSVGISCTVTDSMRVEASVLTGDAEPTDEQRAAVAAALAPLGDLVVYEVRKGAIVPVTPAPAPAPAPAPRVRDYMTVAPPSRCVHGRRITVRAAKRAELASGRISSRGRTLTLRPGRSVRVAIAAKRTRVTVTARLRSGVTATQTFTYMRC
jgi:hypothetical protein